MKLRVRYADEVQVIDLSKRDTEDLWVSLSLEGEGLSQKEREQLIQDAWDEQFNRPDYNNHHKHEQREGFYINQGYEDDRTDGSSEGSGIWLEPLMSEVRDQRIFTKDMDALEEKMEYEAVCAWVRSSLEKKPEWAEAFIAVRLDGMSVREYAAQIGDSEKNVSNKLGRAAKRLKEIYQNRGI